MKTIKLLIVFLLVISSTLLVYWNVFFNDFLVTWDDDAYVLDNPYLSISTFDDLFHLFTITYEGNYHPLTLLSLAIDYWIWGEQPFGFHLTNILLHILNALLVYWLAMLLIQHRLLAVGSALLFALHPMHVESVAWVAERKDVLFLFFLLSGLIAYLYAQKDEYGIRFYHLSICLFCLSLISKPAAIAFPLLLLVLDAWQNRKINLVNKVPFLLISFIFGLITIYAQDSVEAISDLSYFSAWQRVQLVSYSWIAYFYKFFLPIDQTGLYHYPAFDEPFSLLMNLSPFIILLVGILIAWKRTTFIFLGIAFFTISLLPVLQIIPVGNAMMAERYTYLPYLGLNLSIFMLIKQLTKNFNSASLTLYISTFALILLFGIKTSDRTQVWKSDGTFWTDVIQNNPNSLLAHFALGNYLYEYKDFDGSASMYKKVLEFDPFNHQANSFLAFLYNKRRQPQIALAYLDKLVLLDSTDTEHLLKRGKTLMKLKYLEESLLDFNAYIEYLPDDPIPYVLRADNYMSLGKINQAAKDWQSAIDLDTKEAKVFYNMGLYKYEKEDFEKAKLYFKTAVQLNPNKENYRQLAELFDKMDTDIQ